MSARPGYQQGLEDRERAHRLLAARPPVESGPELPAEVSQFHQGALVTEGAYLRREIDAAQRWGHLRRLAEALGVLRLIDWREYVRTDGELPGWAAAAMRGNYQQCGESRG